MRARGLTVALLTVVLLGLSMWLFTLDIYSDDGQQYAGEARPGGSHSFCGSAYDVVLLRGSGFMGGEYPMNRAVLDAECVRKAGRVVALASAAGAAAVLIGAAGAVGAAVRRSPAHTAQLRA